MGKTRASVQGPALLDEWCARACRERTAKGRRKFSIAKIAELIGVAKVSLYKWRHGIWLPKPVYRERIEKLTAGLVPASSWDRARRRERTVKPIVLSAAEAAARLSRVGRRREQGRRAPGLVAGW